MTVSRRFSIVLASAFSAGVFCLNAQVPFEATSSGGFTAAGIPPSDVAVHITHSVVAASPYWFDTLVADETVQFTTVPPSIVDGSFTFAINGGDELTGTFIGTLIPTGNLGEYTASGPFSFNGGTGMFATASGGGQLDAWIQFLDEYGTVGISRIQWEGKIGGVPDGGISAGLLAMSLLLIGGFRRFTGTR